MRHSMLRLSSYFSSSLFLSLTLIISLHFSAITLLTPIQFTTQSFSCYPIHTISPAPHGCLTISLTVVFLIKSLPYLRIRQSETLVTLTGIENQGHPCYKTLRSQRRSTFGMSLAPGRAVAVVACQYLPLRGRTLSTAASDAECKRVL